MRILHVITHLGLGGAEGQLVTLALEMARLGNQVAVISLLPGGENAILLREAGIRVWDLGMRRGIPSLRALFRLRSLLREFDPDIVQSWLYHADFLSLIANQRAGAPPLVWNLRGADIDMVHRGRLLSILMTVLARHAWRVAAVIVNSEAGKVFHAGLGYQPRRWAVMPNALGTSKFRPDSAARIDVRRELGLEADDILVGNVARMDPLKDHDNLLKAAAIVVRRLPGVHFVLVGPGVDGGALGAKIAKLGLDRNVHPIGARLDMPRLQAAWDLAVCASYSEGFPNAIIEAMGCAVPCVSTDVGEVAILIGDTGRVVPVQDPQALATGIVSMLEAPDRVTKGVRARQRVLAAYSTEMVTERYLELYRELVRPDGDEACAA